LKKKFVTNSEKLQLKSAFFAFEWFKHKRCIKCFSCMY